MMNIPCKNERRKQEQNEQNTDNDDNSNNDNDNNDDNKLLLQTFVILSSGSIIMLALA